MSEIFSTVSSPVKSDWCNPRAENNLKKRKKLEINDEWYIDFRWKTAQTENTHFQDTAKKKANDV